MEEVGVELAGHRSKSVDEIDPSTVDVVITWCADEVCPVWLDTARRLHLPLPDPATDDPAVTEAERLERFRGARDAIERHLRRVFDV
jgi:arsenate reductase